MNMNDSKRGLIPRLSAFHSPLPPISFWVSRNPLKPDDEYVRVHFPITPPVVYRPSRMDVKFAIYI